MDLVHVTMPFRPTRSSNNATRWSRSSRGDRSAWPTLVLDWRSSLKTKVIILLAAGVVLSLCALWAESIEYPSNFRRWVRVGTGVVLPDADTKLMSEEGMHDIFANQVAVKGYASGDFPDGSIIVYELREGKPTNGVIVEGERKRVDLMIRNSRLYKSTGGWRFERFWASDQTHNALQDSGTMCFSCHSKAQAHGFVFSQLQ